MKKKSIIISLTFALIVFTLLFITFFGTPTVLINNKKLQRSITCVNAKSVAFNEVVPFKWDAVYSFAPYTSKQSMEKTIGFKNINIRETVNENMTHLVFVKGNRIVSSICGYSENLDYSINFNLGEKNYSKITFNDNCIFSVEKSNDTVNLSYLN